MNDVVREPLRLQDAPLFSGLDERSLALITEIGREKRFAAGETIFSLGASAEELFVVAWGQVALTLPLPVGGTYRVLNVQEMEAGAVLGWSALVAPYKYTFGARAVEDSTLVSVPAVALETLFETYPQIHRTVITNLTGVIASRLTQVQAILVRDLQRRLAEGHALS